MLCLTFNALWSTPSPELGTLNLEGDSATPLPGSSWSLCVYVTVNDWCPGKQHLSQETGWIVSGLLWVPILASIFPNLTRALSVGFCLSSGSFLLLEMKGRERDVQISKSCWLNPCGVGEPGFFSIRVFYTLFWSDFQFWGNFLRTR